MADNLEKYIFALPKRLGGVGEYYCANLPEGVSPPDVGDEINTKYGIIVVSNVRTPDQIRAGRGEPVAKSMERNGVAYRVNFLDKGHEWLERKILSKNIKTAEPFGTDPFGGSHLSDKVRTSPFGAAGGDSHYGLFEPSDGSPGHANDYFSESDKTPTIEERLKNLRKKKKKLKERLRKRKGHKKEAQWGGDGPTLPAESHGDWVADTYKKLTDSENTEGETKDYDVPQTGMEEENTIQKIMNASVVIEATGEKNMEIGSGFFINSMAILTCAHVVMPDGYVQNTRITVKVDQNQYPAYIWAYDQALDIAVIVINDESFHSESFLSLANSSEAELGTEIVVIGNPLGFENIIGNGIVSSGDVNYQEQNSVVEYMFISTNILPGNSGGPVARNDNGAVIGLAAAIISDEQSSSGDGLSAIIPIDKVKPFLKDNGIKFDFKR